MAKIIVREILKIKGITIKELAIRMGVTASAVSQLLANPNPSIQLLERIANVIGVDVMDLFAEDFSYINGYVETSNNIYPVKSREQFVALIDKVEGIAHIPSFSREDIYKTEIKEFLDISINESKSCAKMMRYGINKVFTLSYDAESQKFSLTQCIGNGEVKFKLFDIKDYLTTNNEFYKLLEAIHSEIES